MQLDLQQIYSKRERTDRRFARQSKPKLPNLKHNFSSARLSDPKNFY